MGTSLADLRAHSYESADTPKPLNLLFIALVLSMAIQVGCVTRTGPLPVLNPPKANGLWWSVLPDSERENLIIGMISAFGQGANDGRVRAENYVMSNAGPDAQKLGLGILKLYENPSFSKPTEAYVQSVGQFYKQYPDIATKASVGQVLGCLADVPIQSCADLADWYRHGGTIIRN